MSPLNASAQPWLQIRASGESRKTADYVTKFVTGTLSLSLSLALTLTLALVRRVPVQILQDTDVGLRCHEGLPGAAVLLPQQWRDGHEAVRRRRPDRRVRYLVVETQRTDVRHLLQAVSASGCG